MPRRSGLDQDPDQPEQAERHRGQRQRRARRALTRLRRRCSVGAGVVDVERCGAHVSCPSRLLQLHQQQLRQRQHDEGDEEQHEAELDQRRLVQARRRPRRTRWRAPRRCCWPGSNSDSELSWFALPMTKVTAIVSPSARPRPSMMPPITPTLVYGSTTFHTTSQVVEPSAVGRFLEHRRRDLEHVAHHRGDERDDHDRQDDAGGQHADADRRARRTARRATARSPNSVCSGGCT